MLFLKDVQQTGFDFELQNFILEGNPMFVFEI